MNIRVRATNFLKFLTVVARFPAVAWNNTNLSRMFVACFQNDSEQTQLEIERLTRKQTAMVGFYEEFKKFNYLLAEEGRPSISQEEQYPCLDDRTEKTGFDRHYIYHPAWAARVIAARNPEHHVDISSTLHFATILSAFVKVEFFDFRKAPLTLSNLTSNEADLTQLPFRSDAIKSLSCMHVIEHIGLGRYGDPIDIDGDKKAARELSRVLAPDGDLLVVVPVGRSRIQFNAHRIYSHEQVIELFPDLILVEHALIPDGEAEDGLIENPDSKLISSQSYGCGCYVFSKR